MRRLRIGFLSRSFGVESTSRMPMVMRALADAGVMVEIVGAKGRIIDLSTVRVEHDLYVLKQLDGIPLSIAGILHAEGATIVNPYPVTMALRDKIVACRILQRAGVPMPDSYVVSHPELLVPLLDEGPLIVKPYDGTCGYGVRIVQSAADVATVPLGKNPLLAQRYHPPDGPDLKIYSIGGRLFGVKKIFPARTEDQKHGEPFTPTPELCEIAYRCGCAFGVDIFGVDIIESKGTHYVVDVSSIPGFKGVPDAVFHLANYFYAAADRAMQGVPAAAGEPTLVEKVLD